MKILLVDDSPMQQKIARIYLEKGEGYEMFSAFNGLEAIDAAREHRPDLILLDFEMPGMDGLATLAALKKDECTAEIPVIMCTACEDGELENNALKAGAIGFIRKPHGFKTLRLTIKALHLVGA